MTRKGTGSRVLLAEDDVVYGEAVAALLRSAGHDVRHVTDGNEAVRLLQADGRAFGLILTDLLLPGRTGFDIAREANALGLEAPILAMTGLYDNLREIHALRSLGASGWIHKSAPFEHLLFRVNALLWPASQNDRLSTRIAVALPVQYRHAGRVHYGTTYNVSTTGVYVRTPEPLAAGEIIELALSLPTAREMVTTSAEIVHVATTAEVRGTAYPAGFGARFLQPSPHVTAAVSYFIETAMADESLPAAPAREETESVPAPDPVSACC